MSNRIKKVIARVLLAFVAIVLSVQIIGCGCSREANTVSYNISKEADNFNVLRRITIFNVRTDKVIWTLTGYASVQKTDGDLDVIVEIEDGVYAKNFFDLNEWTSYSVQDLSGAQVDKYKYELEFMPETIPPIKITDNE
jgi:hypothetical protein